MNNRVTKYKPINDSNWGKIDDKASKVLTIELNNLADQRLKVKLLKRWEYFHNAGRLVQSTMNFGSLMEENVLFAVYRNIVTEVNTSKDFLKLREKPILQECFLAMLATHYRWELRQIKSRWIANQEPRQLQWIENINKNH